MKKLPLLFFVLIAGLLLLWFSGCTGEEEKRAEWAIPRFEKKVTVKTEYVVKKGDYISQIAKQYGILPQRLAEVNGLKLKGPGSVIHPGQKLIIPQE